MSFATGLQRFFREYSGHPDLHIIRGHPAADEMLPLPEAEPVTNDARVVEGDALQQIQAPSARESGFAYFLDGIQKSRLAFTWGDIPVLWGFAAACVRQRGPDRRMKTLEGMVATCEALFFPAGLAQDAPCSAFGLTCIDSSPQARRKEEAEHPAYIRQYNTEALSHARQELERDLVRRWAELRTGGWLLVDGSLPGTREDADHRGIVGVIKSHQARYFDGAQQALVTRLPEGHRTSVFQPHRRGGYQPVYSWYLRLRDNAFQDPNFGLIRVEARADAETLQLAGDISGWVLSERTPLSLPDGRWDRMIYPIRDCEQYLRAIAPSAVEMEARLFV